MENVIFGSILGLLTLLILLVLILLILIKELLGHEKWTLEQARSLSGYSKQELHKRIKGGSLLYRRKYGFFGPRVFDARQFTKTSFRVKERSKRNEAQAEKGKTSDPIQRSVPLSVVHALNTLDLRSDASGEQVKHRYHLLAKRYHPDAGGDQQQFINLQAAYRCVTTWMRTHH